MLALGSATEWNNVAEMYLTLTCLLVTLACVMLAFRRDVGAGWKLLFFIPVAFLAFSFRQYWNMLWGYQLTFALTQTFGVLALFYLYLAGQRKALPGLTFTAALGSATVASLSAIQGLFVWPAGLIVLLAASMERRAKRLAVTVWILGGVAVWAIYFLDYETSRASPSEIHPLNNARYFLRMVGGSLFFPQQAEFALASGALIVGLGVAGLFLIYRKGKLGENSFWIALAAFSLLTLAAIAVGRGGLGLAGSLTSRYTTFSVLATIGVYVVLVKLALEKKSYPTRIALAVLLATISLSIPPSYDRGIRSGDATKRERVEAARVLSNYESRSDEDLEKLHRDYKSESLRSRASTLEELELNVFSEP